MSGEHFFNLSVYLSQIFLLALEEFLRVLNDITDKECRERQYQKSDQCHQWADGQHHDQNTDNGCYGCDQLSYTLIHTLTECINVVSHA